MKKFLVIDDEQVMLKLLQRYSERMSFLPTLCDTWEEGMKQFDENIFDLVILDIHMPGKDGFQLAKEIRTLNPEQLILIITGLGAGEVFEYYSSGENEVDFNDIIYKPFSFEKFQAIVTNLFKHHE